MRVDYIRVPSRYEKIYIEDDACIDAANSFLNERNISSHIEVDDISRFLVVIYKKKIYIIRPDSIIYVYKSTIVSIDTPYDNEFSKFMNKLTRIKF